MRRFARFPAILGIAVVVAACSASSGGNGFDLAEWTVEGPSRLSPETGSVSIANSGSLPHTLVVTDSSGEVVAATDLILPGESTEMALDLDEGNYSFTCRIVAETPDGDVVDHYEAGMNATVSVTG